MNQSMILTLPFVKPPPQGFLAYRSSPGWLIVTNVVVGKDIDLFSVSTHHR